MIFYFVFENQNDGCHKQQSIISNLRIINNKVLFKTWGSYTENIYKNSQVIILYNQRQIL